MMDIEVHYEIEVDGRRNVQDLAEELLAAVERVLTSKGRTGRVTSSTVTPDGDVFRMLVGRFPR